MPFLEIASSLAPGQVDVRPPTLLAVPLPWLLYAPEQRSPGPLRSPAYTPGIYARIEAQQKSKGTSETAWLTNGLHE